MAAINFIRRYSGMKHSESSSRSALDLTLRISRAAGVAPVSFTSNGVHISRLAAFYSYILVTVINCTVLTGFAFDMLTEPKRSVRVRTPTSRVIWITNFTIVILITCVSTYRAPSRLDCVIKCLVQIEKIKYFLFNQNSNDSNEKYKIAMVTLFSMTLWFLILCDIYGFLVDALAHGREVRTLLMYSLMYHEYFMELLVKFQFMLTVHRMLSLLNLANDALNNLANIKISQGKCIGCLSLTDFGPVNAVETNHISSHKIFAVVPHRSINIVIDSLATGRIGLKSQSYLDDKISIRDLCSTYGVICDILRRIDDSHGFLFILILVEFFLQLIITPYYLIAAVFNASEKEFNIILQLLWCVYHVANMVIVVEPCYRLQKEMEKTQVLVCNIMRHVPVTDPVLAELDIFWKQLVLDRPSFTPLGLFTLSRPLIVTVIGAVTTYLVIIYQLRSHETSDSS